MNKKKLSVFTRVPRINDHGIRVELRRAHLLVFLLAMALIVTMVISLVPGYMPDRTLSTVAIVLLSLVALFSLSLAVSLGRKR